MLGKGNFRDVISIISYIKHYKFDVVYVMGLRLSIMIRFLKLIFNMKFLLIHGIRWVPSSQTKLDIATRFTEKYLTDLLMVILLTVKQVKKDN